MPYEARGGYVYNTATGQRKNERRLSRPAALRYMRALYANEPATATKAANYGAKVGENITDRLKRGGGGRFSSSGAGTTQGSAQAIVDAERQKPRAAKPAKSKRRATARRRAAPKQPAKTTQQRDQEREKKRVQTVIERVEREDARTRERNVKRQIRLEDQKKRQAARETEKKKRQLAIAQRRMELAKRRQAKPAGGKGSGAKARPTRAQGVKANRTKVVGAIAGDGINQAASDALFAFADGVKGDPGMLQSIADELGLLVKDSAGKYRLSVEGRSFVNASDRGDLRRAQDALSKARDRMAKEQTTTKGALTVFKDTQGRMRWLSVSSTVFKDRDREIVSTPALQADVARSYASGNHGPLRFWHIGRPDPALRSPGMGLDIGDCDYRLFTSKSLIESGTFRNESYAALIRPGDQMSLGFFHSPLEPDGDGVYHSIHSFERSITPAGRASNPFTRITVKEQSMTIPVEKSAEFTARGGDPTLLEALLEQQQQTEKAAEAAGVRFKEHFEPLLADWIAEVKQSGHDELAQAIETWGAAQLKAAAAPPPAVEEEVEVEAEPEGDYDGPLFNQKDTDIMRSVFDEVLGARLEPLMGLLDIEKKMGAHVQNVMGTYTAKKDDEVASLKEAYAESQRHVAELTKRLETLEGLRPRAALEHVPAAPVLPTVKEIEPQADPMSFFREVFAPKTVQSVE